MPDFQPSPTARNPVLVRLSVKSTLKSTHSFSRRPCFVFETTSAPRQRSSADEPRADSRWLDWQTRGGPSGRGIPWYSPCVGAWYPTAHFDPDICRLLDLSADINDKTLDTRLPGFSGTSPDPLRQVEEAGFWLETYRQGVKADPLRVYQMVDRLDELVQSHRLKLTREYLRAGGRQQTYRERRIWTAVVHLARELAAGYETALQLLQAGDPNSPAVAPLVPMITARAMRALTLVLRWTLLRYAAVEPAFWSRIGALYAYAERERFLCRQFKLYPAMAGDSTVRREYLRALVLAVSGTENLLPAGQVVADRVVATVADFFLLHRRSSAGCHFAVDLLASRPPHRVRDGLAPAPTVRFFGPGDAAVMAERLVQRTTQTGGVPPELNLLGEFHASMVLDVLQHLSRHWGSGPPSRSELRQRVLSTLSVAHGFEDVRRAVSAEQEGFELDEITEAWTVEDRAAADLGQHFPHETPTGWPSGH